MPQVVGTIETAPEAVGTGYRGPDEVPARLHREDSAMEQSSPKPLSRRLRFEILRRDEYTCRYCGESAPDVKLTVDHVLPVSLGGTNDPTNLVTACRDCNAGKASTSPDQKVVEDIAQDAMRWSAAMQEAAARLARLDREADEYVTKVDEAWTSYHTQSGDVWRPMDWRASVRQFRQAGLSVEAAIEAVAIAMGHRKIKNDDVWRYFCGICWRKVDQLQQIAAQIVQESD